MNKGTKEYKEYLDLIRKIFEKRAGEKLSDKRVEAMAEALARIGVVFHIFLSKQEGKEPIFTL